MKVDKNLIFDVGMHKGEDTAFYLKKGFNVVAFEADPDLAAACKNRFSDEINSGRLTLVQGAIVDTKKVKDKTISFYKNNDQSVWGTVVEKWADRNKKMGATSQIIEVQTIDFGKCLEQYGIPHYLKIDIEGMDTICLEALLPFEEKPNYISIESEKVSFEKLEYEFELFDRLGYNKYQVVNQAEITKQKEPADSKEGKNIGYSFEEGSSGIFGSDFRAPWITKQKALSKYKWIFKGYKIWGDHSKIRRWFVMRVLRVLLSTLLGSYVPGWYDTHARHSSVNEG